MGRGWRPIVVGAAVVVAVFAVAQAQIFETDAAPTTPAATGDEAHGATIFEQTCASCHGSGGVGGSPGPRLVGSSLDAVQVAATIDAGVGVMPPALVTGQEEADVVAYVVSISSP